MDHTLHERLARVETRLDGIEKQTEQMATDLRVVRDHVISATNATKAHRWIVSSLLAVLGATAAFMGNVFHLRS